MFTGIIETTGQVVKAERQGTNTNFLIQSAISADLKVDQSVSHNGVCLTVTAIEMSPEILGLVPQILEHPTFDILKSKTAPSEHNIYYRTQ